MEPQLAIDHHRHQNFREPLPYKLPGQFHTLWKQGIDTNAYYLKLWGSGGRGYILGFTEDLDKAKVALRDHKLEEVYSF